MSVGLLENCSVIGKPFPCTDFRMLHCAHSAGFASRSMALVDLSIFSSVKAQTSRLRRRKERKPVLEIGSRTSVAVLLLNAVSTSQESEQCRPSNKLQAQYRPAVVLPGLGNNSADYASLVSSLEARGISSTVAEVSRADWLRNAAGLLDGNYWKGTLTPRPVLDWYLERIRRAIEVAKDLSSSDKVSIIGHSAGGWLARVYMAEFGTSDIALLLTLGTPHLPPPKGKSGVFDQTRGLLDYVEKTCPGAFYKPDVSYVCVAGRYLKGGKFFPAESLSVISTGVESLASSDPKLLVTAVGSEKVGAAVEAEHAPASFRERIIGQAYKQVCGLSNVWGDGVVPEISSLLDGAINITLDGVYHSPVGSDDSKRPWYGSPSVLEQWIHYLLD
ncbi:hypothetical protein O6H91_20G058400 [Diphasiastrum complanatum]|uniref:Uncharacterized protein n=1 Tax=Diphasiastrum complanatum TaxID=34168 RepID=A0ACC2AQV6_DIPCM|nr:hypothetical protein O6H91_20G058400 [Diphasiastrum complanatum]